MKEIFSSVIRKKVIKLINDIGLGVSEIIIDLPLSFETFDTIELNNNSITLHKFMDDLDYTTDFDYLDDEDKLSSPKLIFKCGSDDLTMVTQIDLTKKVFNKQLLASLKNQFCMKNSKGIIVPKADFAANNTQTDPTTGVA